MQLRKWLGTIWLKLWHDGDPDELTAYPNRYVSYLNLKWFMIAYLIMACVVIIENI